MVASWKRSNAHHSEMSNVVFRPERLRLARELAEWSQAELARKLQLTAVAVGQFEAGVTRPSTGTLARLGELLDVPPGFFALPFAETHEGFFRSLRRTSVGHRRRARAIAHIAYDVASSEPARDHLPPLDLPKNPTEDLDVDQERIEDIAALVREAWNLPRGPIPNMVDLLEDKGVVVIRLPLDTADVDAFSLPFPDHPVIVLGTEKNDRARSRFDAAHELGHLVVHGDQVWGIKEVEKQADMFAAAFLMPARDIEDELPTAADWPMLFALKKRWQVSLAALLMRAKTLKRMSDATYLAAIKAASARGWRRLEPVPLGAPERPARMQEILNTIEVPSGLPPLILEALAGATAA